MIKHLSCKLTSQPFVSKSGLSKFSILLTSKSKETVCFIVLSHTWDCATKIETIIELNEINMHLKDWINECYYSDWCRFVWTITVVNCAFAKYCEWVRIRLVILANANFFHLTPTRFLFSSDCTLVRRSLA